MLLLKGNTSLLKLSAKEFVVLFRRLKASDCLRYSRVLHYADSMSYTLHILKHSVH